MYCINHLFNIELIYIWTVASKNMKYLLVLLLFLFVVTPMTTFAQSKTTEKTSGGKKINVVGVYEELVNDGKGTPYIYKELAYAYYFRNDYKEAKKWFEKLFKAEAQSDEKVKHRYKQTLKALHKDFTKNRYLVKKGGN